MPASEFELIARHFTGRGAARADVRLGVGDDAALLLPRPGMELVQALDSIVGGVHFPADTAGACVGHRALAVNLSDLAAMGAEPAWALLGLTLPAPDEEWLAGFSGAFHALASRHGVALVGGDLSAGPLAATVALSGWVEAGAALRRDGARPGDRIWISGQPGEAGAGLAILQGRLVAAEELRDALVARFLWPEPRVGLGRALAGLATACIDVSDGVAGDLQRLCEASQTGADLDSARLPLSPALAECAGSAAARALALGAGDDYELLFTAPAAATSRIEALSGDPPLTCIGEISGREGLRVDGAPLPAASGGYQHFQR